MTCVSFPGGQSQASSYDVDWSGYMTDVEPQPSNGPCNVMAITSLVEANWAIQKGQTNPGIDLAERQAWTLCPGAPGDIHALKNYVKNVGLIDDNTDNSGCYLWNNMSGCNVTYGVANNLCPTPSGGCNAPTCSNGSQPNIMVKANGYVGEFHSGNVTEDELKNLVDDGPVAIRTSGVAGGNCYRAVPSGQSHAVVVVAYKTDSSDNVTRWKVKDSWEWDTGMQGFREFCTDKNTALARASSLIATSPQRSTLSRIRTRKRPWGMPTA